MRRRLLLALLIGSALLLTWSVWIVTTSFARAPKLVAELDAGGALAFSPLELPRQRLCALLAVQDPTFFRHHGIGLADGPLGHTTLTQAVVKRLFFNDFDPGRLRHRKIRLMLTAWVFDGRITKETQLRLFLNLAHFGNAGGTEVLGFPAAASAFLDKSLDQLSDSEYFGLLAMLDAPNRYDILRQPRLNAERVARIQRLVERVCVESCFQDRAPIPCDG